MWLCCVQQCPENRPNMSSAVLMLGSEAALPRPKRPGFFTGRNLVQAVFIMLGGAVFLDAR